MLFIQEKIEEAVSILKEAEKAGAVLSFSGGRDSTVLHHLIQNNSINIDSIFINKQVENKYNNKIIKQVIPLYKEVLEAKTKSYKEIVYELGFPIKNKNFSQLCYRLRKIDKKNYKDVYKVVTGISPQKVEQGELGITKINPIYSLDLNYWYLATNYPIQTRCCDILKKQPAKKIKRPMIIGIMKDDSPARRRAIKEQENKEVKTKYFPLQNWTKKDVEYYVNLYKVPVSDSYKTRMIESIEILPANGTGCVGCHYGQNDYKIKVKDELIKTTKFEVLKIEQPKMYNYIMSMKHKSGISFKEVLDIYEKSSRDLFLKESIEARNKYINIIINYLKEDGYSIAIEYIKTFYIYEE